MNKKAIKGCSMLVLVLLISIICFYTSSSAKVYRGTFEKNTKWTYDTRSKTVTIDCKGRMADCFADDAGLDCDWQKFYNKAKKLVFLKGITYIGGSSFEDFVTLEQVILPKGVVSIGAYAFEKAYKLTKINFPSTLRNIGESSFDSTGLSHISLQNVIKIGESAFFGTNIHSLLIPSNCKYVNNNAFTYCRKLKSVTIEKGIKKLVKECLINQG